VIGIVTVLAILFCVPLYFLDKRRRRRLEKQKLYLNPNQPPPPINIFDMFSIVRPRLWLVVISATITLCGTTLSLSLSLYYFHR
jgi:hypothetical protein